MRQYSLRSWLVAVIAAGLTLSAGTQRPAYCWDKFAHEVIAQIAWDHMTPLARSNANTLIAAFNADSFSQKALAKYRPYNFVTAASFMDDIAAHGRAVEPGTTQEYDAWHFIDLPNDPDLTIGQIESFRDQSPSNVYLAIHTACLPALESPYYPPAYKARALAMFLHFAGDIHQPLHTTARGLGGNRYPIDPLPTNNPQFPVQTLHAFWDGAYRYSASHGTVKLVEPASDMPRLDTPGQGETAVFARKLEARYGKQETADAQNIDPAVWAQESNRIATNYAFVALNNATTLPDDYVNKSAEIAEKRLVVAGLRIANVLNVDLGPPKPQPKYGG